jgi:hypothetical protein
MDGWRHGEDDAFHHTDSRARDFAERPRAFGYADVRLLAENIGKGVEWLKRPLRRCWPRLTGRGVVVVAGQGRHSHETRLAYSVYVATCAMFLAAASSLEDEPSVFNPWPHIKNAGV